jgi:hypothetical protein
MGRLGAYDEADYPATDFADLYHARWRIEEAFKRIKHRLAREQISGISWGAAQQDFGAKLLCDNLNALAVWAAAPEPVTPVQATLVEPTRSTEPPASACLKAAYSAGF